MIGTDCDAWEANVLLGVPFVFHPCEKKMIVEEKTELLFVSESV